MTQGPWGPSIRVSRRRVQQQPSGGVCAAFGDSSVQFLSASITPELLKQLANRSDGQLPSKEDRY